MTMRFQNRLLTRGRRVLLKALFPAMLVFTAPSYSQAYGSDPPANAHKNNYDDGWECDRDFEKKDGACLAIVVPENAHGTNASYGRTWECNRGYRRSEESCAEIIVPPNGYLNSFGDAWICDREYKKTGKTCARSACQKTAFFPMWAMALGGNAVGAIALRPAVARLLPFQPMALLQTTGAKDADGNASEATEALMIDASRSISRRTVTLWLQAAGAAGNAIVVFGQPISNGLGEGEVFAVGYGKTSDVETG